MASVFTPYACAPRDQGIRVEDVPKVTLDRLAAGERHQGVVVVCQQISPHTEREFEEAFFWVGASLCSWFAKVCRIRAIWDRVLRTADAAGVDAVLFARNRERSSDTRGSSRFGRLRWKRCTWSKLPTSPAGSTG